MHKFRLVWFVSLTLSFFFHYRTKDEVWACGGSNTLYVSKDGGKNFSFDKSANDIPGNLYNIKFFKEFGNKGFALGSNGLLLKYEG